MRTCIFCNKRANTIEDAWPVWLMNRFPSSGNASMEFELQEREIGIWPANKPTLQVKRVCSSCNNGWMSELENQTKPIIESILDERKKCIDITSQETLARWSVKTVMVLEAIDSNRQRFYSERDRNAMKTSLVIPIHTTVWISKCTKQPNVYSKAKDLFTGVRGTRAFANTLAFGSLAIQVMTIHPELYIPNNTNITYDVREGSWDETLLQIWPSHKSLEWPLKYGLEGELGLETLSERFSSESHTS